MAFVVPIVILAVMWGVVILPQQRRVRAHRAFVDGLQVGDEVITTSGFYGEILSLDDETARLRLAPDAVVTVARLAIARSQHEPEAEPAADEPTPDADVEPRSDENAE